MHYKCCAITTTATTTESILIVEGRILSQLLRHRRTPKERWSHLKIPTAQLLLEGITVEMQLKSSGADKTAVSEAFYHEDEALKFIAKARLSTFGGQVDFRERVQSIQTTLGNVVAPIT